MLWRGPHLQSAAVRPLALGPAHQHRRVGHGGLSRRLPHRRQPAAVRAALRVVDGGLDAARAWPALPAALVVAVSRRGAAPPRRRTARMGHDHRAVLALRRALRPRRPAGYTTRGRGRLRYRVDDRVAASRAAGGARLRPHPRHVVAARPRWRPSTSRECRGRRRCRRSRDAVRSALLLARRLGAADVLERDAGPATARVLTELAGVLRAARPARPVDLDDGWRATRDLSIAVQRWGWLHVRALVEEHAEGRCLLRVDTAYGAELHGRGADAHAGHPARGRHERRDRPALAVDQRRGGGGRHRDPAARHLADDARRSAPRPRARPRHAG